MKAIKPLFLVSFFSYGLFSQAFSIFNAISNGDIPLVRGLITSNPDVALQKNARGFSTLQCALLHRKFKIACILVKGTKVDINEPLPADFTFKELRRIGCRPLQIAYFSVLSKYSKPLLLKYLIKYGANPHLQDAKGQNLLHYAAILADTKTMRKLVIEWKLNLNIKDKEGRTPLYLALASQSEKEKEMVDLLLTHGADPTLTTIKGDSALHRMLRILPDLEKQAVLKSCLTRAHLTIPTQLAKYFKKALPDDVIFRIISFLPAGIDVQNTQGETALHIAARNNDTETLIALANTGANLLEIDNEQRTPQQLLDPSCWSVVYIDSYHASGTLQRKDQNNAIPLESQQDKEYNIPHKEEPAEIISHKTMELSPCAGLSLSLSPPDNQPQEPHYSLLENTVSTLYKSSWLFKAFCLGAAALGGYAGKRYREKIKINIAVEQLIELEKLMHINKITTEMLNLGWYRILNNFQNNPKILKEITQTVAHHTLPLLDNDLKESDFELL